MLVVLLIVSLTAGAFLATRIYLLLVKGELDVRGVVYSRRETPVSFYLVLATVTVGLAMVLLIAGFLLAYFATGWI